LFQQQAPSQTSNLQTSNLKPQTSATSPAGDLATSSLYTRLRSKLGINMHAMALPKDGSAPQEVLLCFGIIDHLQVGFWAAMLQAAAAAAAAAAPPALLHVLQRLHAPTMPLAPARLLGTGAGAGESV
jgi:hypothetical protein